MHLLMAQKGSLADADEAIDLGQAPADLVVISAADTELTGLAAAHEAMRGSGDITPTLRLANMTMLSHPMSIDVYCEKTIAGSRMVIVRCLGGESYWSYGLQKLRETCLFNDVTLIVLPGDDKVDPSLAGLSTISETFRERLWATFIHGGAANMRTLLEGCARFLEEGSEDVGEAAPVLKAGLWWPGSAAPAIDDLRQDWLAGAPIAAITFYRALVLSGNTEPVAALISALRQQGINALPIFVSSLKDAVSQETVRALFAEAPPAVVINLTGFAVSSPGADRVPTVLEEGGATVLQAVLASGGEETWEASDQGLSARDLAMNVALPEIDGRVFSRAIAFKNANHADVETQANLVRHMPRSDRVAFVAKLAAAWARLRIKEAREKRVAIVLANYPNKDGRLANGVGLDTPAGTVNVLRAMREAGHAIENLPENGDALIARLREGPTNAGTEGRRIETSMDASHYKALFAELPAEIQDEVIARWGAVEGDPLYMADRDALALPVVRYGSAFVGVQPARGYNIDPTDTYHSPDLVPPHNYFAFYLWLRHGAEVDAVVHMGKHGNLEWLPGKALSLSEACHPEALLGPMPHLYPFIVNDPGEGTQAKRRTAAVIVDHLTPPLTRAESHGDLRHLEALVDEYYDAAGVDPRRLAHLRKEILALMRDSGLDQDIGIASADADDDALEKLDTYLCELKEMQIRDGLHIFGEAPQGRLETDLAVALVRVPRGLGEGGEASLQRAIATDLDLTNGGVPFDPLDCEAGQKWRGERPAVLAELSSDTWRSVGDTVERIEFLASDLVSGEHDCAAQWLATCAVLEEVHGKVLPAIRACGSSEIDGLLAGLGGRFVPPGPSGAPSRGRSDVLPTGRNFYSVDTRAVPTPAAWHLGQKSAELLLKRHRQDHGEWPKALGLSAWGTANMRTGGDDIAQAFALIGARPVWEHASRRVTGFEIITLAELGRPRIDVTLRISGFFRDAFPAQIALFDQAVRAIAALEEEEKDNPLAARVREQQATLIAQGADAEEAASRAGFRIFGAKPGAYGAGLQALIDEGGWQDRSDFAEAYEVWGGYAYGAKTQGAAARDEFHQRLGSIEAVVHNQDNREHDLLDSDDYYQFEGGMSAAVEAASGSRPTIYHNDHSRPERPVIRTLEEEIGRVVRARVTNPKWIAGVMRHGYKGAFEIAATVDYLFAFSATTGAVRDHHFDAVYQSFITDDTVRQFIEDHNPDALKEMCARLLEALERDLWTARSNSARFDLERLARGETNIKEAATHG